MNDTLNTFEYPSSGLAETENWLILLRPKQVTLGSLVLVVRDATTRSMSTLSPEAVLELPFLCRAIETALTAEFGAAKFNYLCLMMVDPQVHFHVIPRYSSPVSFANHNFIDTFWPGPPDILAGVALDTETHTHLHALLRTAILKELSS